MSAVDCGTAQASAGPISWSLAGSWGRLPPAPRPDPSRPWRASGQTGTPPPSAGRCGTWAGTLGSTQINIANWLLERMAPAPLGWCSSCKTIRGQQWDLHRDSAALLLGSNSAEGVTSSAHSAHVHHDTRPREKLSNSILSTSYKIASSWVLVLILCSIGRRA